MSLKIDLEREFFKTARFVETKTEARQAFLIRMKELSEDWINDKFRWDIAGLKD